MARSGNKNVDQNNDSAVNIKVNFLPEGLMEKKDFWLGVTVGLIIGIMSMPVLYLAKPDLFYMLRFVLVPFFLIGTPLGLIVCHKLGKKLPVIWQFGKFFVTGIMNVLVDFGFLAIVSLVFRKTFGISSEHIIFGMITFYSFYKALSFTVANINSYFWNKYWTFDQGKEKKSEFLQFFSVSIIGFAINVGVATFVFNSITPLAGMNSDQWGFMGAAAGSIMGLAWNFLGYKFLVFKK